MAATTFRGTCPACGEGHIFRGVFELRSACSACHIHLEGRDGAHYGGPIALGYGIGGMTGLAVFAILFGPFGFRTWVVWASVGAVVVAILATFRQCKAWWTWWLYRMGELGGDRK